MLLTNNNRKFVKTLSDNCLKANRLRNRIAMIAIILTAVLFAALLTVFDGTSQTIKEQLQRQSGSTYMVSVKFISDAKLKELRENPVFGKTGVQRALGYVKNKELNNMSVSLCQEEEAYSKNTFKKLIQGEYPQKENEIACDTEVLKELGVKEKVGEKFKLQYVIDGKTKEREMTLCGFWEGQRYQQIAELLISESFLKAHIGTGEMKDGDMSPGAYVLRGSFASDKNVKEALDEVLKAAGYRPESERGEEGFVVHHVNPAYEGVSDMSAGAMLGIFAGAIIILLAGYLVIYNIFRISVMKDIQLYGQLKTVGAAPKQLKYMIKRQGMRLCLIGVPIGIVGGWLLGNLLLPIVMKGSSFKETSFLMPNLWGWLAAAVFTVFTVWISCSRPGKMAARIAPVEAMYYQEADHGSRKSKKGKNSGHRILQMAWANMGRNPGKTGLVVLSMSLSIILLNSIYNYVGCFDMETYVKRALITDFKVSNVEFGKAAGEDQQKTISLKLIEQLETDTRIANFGRIYYRGAENQEERTSYKNLAHARSINHKPLPQSEKEQGGIHQIYGLSDEVADCLKLVEGSLDMDKLNSGNYVIALGFLGDRGDYYLDYQIFHAGDVVEAEIDGVAKEYEVLAVAGLPGALLMDTSIGCYEGIAFSQQAFLEKFPENERPIHCVFNAEEGTFDELNNDMTSLAKQRGLSVSTRLTFEAEFKQYVNTYRNAGTILALVFGLIGILNLLNVQLTGAISRQKEFASMRSIGLSGSQLRRLFVLEGIFYGIAAGAAGILLSSICSVTIVRGLTSGIWFGKYRFMAGTAFIVAILGIVLSAGIAYFIDKLWNHGSIVENLRRME